MILVTVTFYPFLLQFFKSFQNSTLFLFVVIVWEGRCGSLCFHYQAFKLLPASWRKMSSASAFMGKVDSIYLYGVCGHGFSDRILIKPNFSYLI